jgi:hypothetical protein
MGIDQFDESIQIAQRLAEYPLLGDEARTSLSKVVYCLKLADDLLVEEEPDDLPSDQFMLTWGSAIRAVDRLLLVLWRDADVPMGCLPQDYEQCSLCSDALQLSWAVKADYWYFEQKKLNQAAKSK